MTIHKSLQKLTNVINTNKILLSKLIYQGKEKFANNEDNINIAIGLLNELSIIIRFNASTAPDKSLSFALSNPML